MTIECLNAKNNNHRIPSYFMCQFYIEIVINVTLFEYHHVTLSKCILTHDFANKNLSF